MHDKMKNLATFEVSVGGVLFEVRRRSTGLMIQIGGVREVFGLMQGAIAALKAEDQIPDQTESAQAKSTSDAEEGLQKYIAMQEKAVALIIVAMDGEPVTEVNPVRWEDIASAFDVIFPRFLSSALSADPMPDSCGGPKE